MKVIFKNRLKNRSKLYLKKKNRIWAPLKGNPCLYKCDVKMTKYFKNSKKGEKKKKKGLRVLKKYVFISNGNDPEHKLRTHVPQSMDTRC